MVIDSDSIDLSVPFVVDSDSEAAVTCDKFKLPLVMLELRSPGDDDLVAAAVRRCCMRRCANTSLVSAGGRGCGGGNISWQAFNLAAMIYGHTKEQKQDSKLDLNVN